MMKVSSRIILVIAVLFVLCASAWSILHLGGSGQGVPAKSGIGMKRFVTADSARSFENASFEDTDGATRGLDGFGGRVVLVNLWARWCPPCKEEMPTLAKLQSLQGGEDFQVVTVAIEDVEVPEVVKALEELGAPNLPPYRDLNTSLTQELGAIGLPTSVLLDKRGLEIGRLSGPAKWDSDAALRLIRDARAGVLGGRS
ncbi:MAG: TlpA disulfide reductase family protein [Hyphomicrobiales bacterium]|nr:TlpA disulfide reductase family protein [Hyphomicrobiales bacterium]MCY4037834.1 TlpA disulfide reductase family protein [Hyphomicrobiales bacterium]